MQACLGLGFYSVFIADPRGQSATAASDANSGPNPGTFQNPPTPRALLDLDALQSRVRSWLHFCWCIGEWEVVGTPQVPLGVYGFFSPISLSLCLPAAHSNALQLCVSLSFSHCVCIWNSLLNWECLKRQRARTRTRTRTRTCARARAHACAHAHAHTPTHAQRERERVWLKPRAARAPARRPVGKQSKTL